MEPDFSTVGPEIKTVDLDPLLEGAVLLAIDELIAGHPVNALNVLLSARVAMHLYQRAQSLQDMQRLALVARALEFGE